MTSRIRLDIEETDTSTMLVVYLGERRVMNQYVNADLAAQLKASLAEYEAELEDEKGARRLCGAGAAALRDSINRAVDVAMRFGTTDGEHHKAWVIDQMLRALLGDGYQAAVGDDWEEGIEP